MICPKCNQEASDSDKFCYNCGSKLINENKDTIPQNKEIKTYDKKLGKIINNKIKYKILIAALVIITLGAGMSLAAYNNSKTQNASNKNSLTASLKVKVPNTKNRSADDAKKIIKSSKLTVGKITEEYSDSIPKDKIISQQPAEGVSVQTGASVDLVVSKGKKELTPKEGAIILKNKTQKDMKFIQASNIGSKKYYWYDFLSDEYSGGDIRYCIDPLTGDAYIYNSDASLHPYDNPTLVISTERADWHKELNNKIQQQQAKRKPYSGHWISYNYYNEIDTKLDGGSSKTQISQEPYEVYFMDNKNTVTFKQGENIKTLHYNEQRSGDAYGLNVNSDILFTFGNDGVLLQSIIKLSTNNETINWMVQFKYVDDKQTP